MKGHNWSLFEKSSAKTFIRESFAHIVRLTIVIENGKCKMENFG